MDTTAVLEVQHDFAAEIQPTWWTPPIEIPVSEAASLDVILVPSVPTLADNCDSLNIQRGDTSVTDYGMAFSTPRRDTPVILELATKWTDSSALEIELEPPDKIPDAPMVGDQAPLLTTKRGDNSVDDNDKSDGVFADLGPADALQLHRALEAAVQQTTVRHGDTSAIAGNTVASAISALPPDHLMHWRNILLSPVAPQHNQRHQHLMDAVLLSVYCDDLIVHAPPDYALFSQRLSANMRCRALSRRLLEVPPPRRIIARDDRRLPDPDPGDGIAPTVLPAATVPRVAANFVSVADDPDDDLPPLVESDTDDDVPAPIVRPYHKRSRVAFSRLLDSGAPATCIRAQ